MTGKAKVLQVGRLLRERFAWRRRRTTGRRRSTPMLDRLPDLRRLLPRGRNRRYRHAEVARRASPSPRPRGRAARHPRARTIGSAGRGAPMPSMEIGYQNRAPRADAAARYFPRLLGLADWCRFLVVCCPGGPATHNLLEGQVLGALGPGVARQRGARFGGGRGNAGCGLEVGRMAGAGLDVFASEPAPRPAL